MIIAAIKNGVVVGKYSVGDVDSVIALADSKAANVNDLYDGKVFKVNPDAANLKAAALKKQEIISKLQKADAAMVTAVDAIVNPK